MTGNWADKLIRTPLNEIGEKSIFGHDIREEFRNADFDKFRRGTGLEWDEYNQMIPLYSERDGMAALRIEGARQREAAGHVAIVDQLEQALIELINGDERCVNAVRLFSIAAFNCGVWAGMAGYATEQEVLDDIKTQKIVGGTLGNLTTAVEERRKLGEPTRQKAREIMRQRPHLSWTACANVIAESGRDARGVARVIEELFPRGADGTRRYVGDNPPDRPGEAPETP